MSNQTDSLSEENTVIQSNKNGSLIGRLAQGIVKILMILICAYLSVASIFTTVRLSSTEHIYFTADNPMLHVAIIIMIIAIVTMCRIKANKREATSKEIIKTHFLNTKKLFYIVWALFTVLLVVIVATSRLIPTFDQLHVSEAAIDILHRDYSSFLRGGYARLWDNQSGFILFLTLVFRVFGENNFTAVQVINIICYSGSVLLIRALSERLLTENGNTANVIGVVTCAFMPLWFYTTFVYGTAPALVLSLAAMALEYDYYNASAKKIWKILASAVLIALATVLKTNAIIYMLAMLAYAAVKTLDSYAEYRKTAGRIVKLDISKTEEASESLINSESDEESTQPLPSYDDILDAAAEHYEKTKDIDRFVSLRGALGILAILVMYVVVSKGISITMTNITGMSDLSGTPRTAHIAMGLQESSNKSSGWFNGYNESVYVNNGYDHDAANDAAIVNIKMSIGRFKQNPPYAVGFFLKKIVSQWCEPTYESMFIMMTRRTQAAAVAGWLSEITIAGFGNSGLAVYMNIFQTLLYFGALVYFIDCKIKGIDSLFPAIVVIGGFLFHLMWEANSQYILVYAILMIGYSVKGYGLCAEKLAVADKALLSKADSVNSRKAVSHIGAFVAAAVVIVALVAIVPDESFIGRAFKMNWNSEEYLITRARDAQVAGDWVNTVCAEGTMEIKPIGGQQSNGSGKAVIKNGRYVLRPYIDQDHMLVVSESGMEYGDKIIVDQADENRVIIQSEDGGYVIRFQNSQLVMDIDMASTEPGTGAQQWGYNGDVSQIYDIMPADNGTYLIVYRENMALTTDGDGQVYVDMLEGTDDQKWIFEKVK